VSAFDRAIQLAKGQLPAAFTVGGGLPYSDGEAPRAIVPESDEGLLADRVVAIETINPTGTEDIEDFEDAVKEIGFEAIAFYISFHRPTPQGQWGIFYFDHRVRQFAEVVRREFQLKPDEAARQAFNIVRAHERFHFRFDVSALYHELILKKPLYNEYFASVYRTVYCTAECFEEALANRACLELPLIPRPRKSAWYIETRQSAMKPFLEKLFARLPPGYKDYGRPLNELCSGLEGNFLRRNRRHDCRSHRQAGLRA